MTHVLVIALAIFVSLPAFADSTRFSLGSRIAVFLDSRQPLDPAVERQLRAEVEQMFLPAAITFEWHSLADRDARDSFPDLIVVRLRGACDLRTPATRTSNAHALGATAVTDGLILPYSTLECDAIRRLIATGPEDSGESAFRFGRALGRVLAHEIYHIAARTPHHSRQGAAKPAYSSRELTAGEFQFDGEDTRTLRRARGVFDPAPVVPAASQ